MGYLKYYDKEDKKYPDLDHLYVSNDEAKQIISKAIKRFNISTMICNNIMNDDTVVVNAKFDSSYYMYYNDIGKIRLASDPVVLTILHELAHAMQHTNRLKNNIVINPCKRMVVHNKEHASYVNQLAKWFKRNNKRWGYGIPIYKIKLED